VQHRWQTGNSYPNNHHHGILFTNITISPRPVGTYACLFSLPKLLHRNWKNYVKWESQKQNIRLMHVVTGHPKSWWLQDVHDIAGQHMSCGFPSIHILEGNFYHETGNLLHVLVFVQGSCPKSFRWCTCPLEKDPNSSHCQHFLCLKISSLCKGLDQSNLSWIICRNFTSHNTGIKDYRNNDPDKNMSSLWEFKSKRSMNTNRLLDKKTFRELI